MCFGSGFLIYGFVPPKVCPGCKGKGVMKIKKNSSPFYWIKLLKRKNLMGNSRLLLGWFSIIGIIILFAMLLGISYVWMFVNGSH